MPPRRRRSAEDLPAGGLLDWKSSDHWSPRERPCRCCERPTHLRDVKGRPAHKVCAEAELAEVVKVVQAHAQGQL
ncbi:hypothetical protein ACFRFL_13865 [Streptomyces sp. NPDC056708]|uniref:hypothetical protein n=1 Tax=unclassified Streptomyces TaxID=2593676 RepID=UPI0036AC8679